MPEKITPEKTIREEKLTKDYPSINKGEVLVPPDAKFETLEKSQPHQKARKEKPRIYPDRFPVPDDKVSWGADYPDYDPPSFVAELVLENDCIRKQGGWADPESIEATKEIRDIVSYEGVIRYDKEGYPLNPRGRTGIRGRGLLGKHGPNFAADPIVTRVNVTTGQLEILLIQRSDTGEMAIPGGMVDYGEKVSSTLRREFKEEAGTELDFGDAELVYQGYVDDPRNTDNAWMETSVYHLHLEERGMDVFPEAGSDAVSAQWVVANQENLRNLYASHSASIGETIKKWQEKAKKVVRKDGAVGIPAA
ncbi:MAG: NUDIX domain-containing protein [Candidatus Cloacimonetes bacterium]|nr:NUDIX domain-containing protein [Candidatus Cloacimonadota bacterium]